MNTIEDTKTISILGCGWLGLPLGALLVEKGYRVNGASTRPEKFAMLEKAGILPFQIALNPELKGELTQAFFASEILIVNIPPQTRKKGPKFHPLQVQYLVDYLKDSPVKKIIYVSSTSVYPEVDTWVDEMSALDQQNPRAEALIQGEAEIRKFAGRWMILRASGLMGYDRVPGKYFAGKKELKTGRIPVNYIHRDDIIRIIAALLAQPGWEEIFNIVAPEHPTRRDIYLKNASDFGFEAPGFLDAPAQGYKIVSGQKLQGHLSYKFKYPNPLDFRY